MRRENLPGEINWPWFLGMQVLALLLMLSWLNMPTREAWLALDESFFRYFNSSLLDGGDTWRTFWAATNHRMFDVAAGVILLLLYIFELAHDGKPKLAQNLALMTVLVIALGVSTLGGQLLPIERPSATLVYADAFRLSEWNTAFPTKDSSRDTFPGDHGMVLFIVSGFALYYLRARYGLLAVLLSLFFVAPRMVVGAHWLTDEVVGAVAVGLVALAWFLFTPLGSLLIDISTAVWRAILNLLGLEAA